jgi:repressor LexA
MDSIQVREYNLTQRQQEVLDIIVGNIKHHGYPPTVRELRDHLGVNSIRGASIHLDALERKGYIQRNGKARGIKVLKIDNGATSRQEIRIPLIGQIQAGYPLLAEENVEKFINIKKEYLRGNTRAFALRVHGHSMINAGIRPGDIALITPTQHAENGDIVVALFEDSATLKKFYQVDDYIALLPANPDFEPIIGDNFSIQGKLVGIIRANEEPSGSLTNEACLVPIYREDILAESQPVVKWVYGRTID